MRHNDNDDDDTEGKQRSALTDLQAMHENGKNELSQDPYINVHQ